METRAGALFCPRALLQPAVSRWRAMLGRWTRRSRWSCFTWSVASAMIAALLPAAAADISLQTGGGEPLVTATVDALLPSSLPLPRLSLDLAFATDEAPQPASFLDSFSVTLKTADGSRTALLLTADAFGLQLAPPNPGGFTIAPGSIQAEPISYFGSATDPANRIAFTVSFDVPAEFTGQTNTVFFDLFDNGNPVASVGLARNIAVVPEPVTGLLLLLGALVAIAMKRLRS